jgi:GH24 family phage-related lysozyme (muramidase)
MRLSLTLALLVAFICIAVWWEQAVFAESTDDGSDLPGDDNGGANDLVQVGGDLAGLLVGDAGALQQPGHFRYSPNMLHYVKVTEGGLHTKAYYDVHGYSLGYGHYLGNSSRGSSDASRTCTQAQAEQWLSSDLGKALSAVNQLVTVKLTQGEVDSLVDFQFNEGSLATSRLLQDVNNGNTTTIANDFLQYTRAGASKLVLQARRLKELSWTDWGVSNDA